MNTSLPPDHAVRLERLALSLDGLSLGDALGSQFFIPRHREILSCRPLPRGPWHYTDDTEMALGLAQVLRHFGRVEQDRLARVFAFRWDRDMYRGYGAGAHLILAAVHSGQDWREAAHAAFDGMGSMGNGGAMRVAPLGAYFAEDDWALIAEQARLSAEVTHAHPEGQAGAIAVAVAAASAWRHRERPLDEQRAALWHHVMEWTPVGPTRQAIAQARTMPLDAEVPYAVYELGNGSRVISEDTVPFCLWCATRYLDDFEEAIWTTLDGGGDIDTNAAIVGGIVALSAGRHALPFDWLQERETLDPEATRPPPVRHY